MTGTVQDAESSLFFLGEKHLPSIIYQSVFLGKNWTGFNKCDGSLPKYTVSVGVISSRIYNNLIIFAKQK